WLSNRVFQTYDLMTTSSPSPPMPGISSPIGHGLSCPSPHEIGQQSVTITEDWYLVGKSTPILVRRAGEAFRFGRGAASAGDEDQGLVRRAAEPERARLRCHPLRSIPIPPRLACSYLHHGDHGEDCS